MDNGTGQQRGEHKKIENGKNEEDNKQRKDYNDIRQTGETEEREQSKIGLMEKRIE